LPEPLAFAIEAESRLRKLSKSEIVRERLLRAFAAARQSNSPASSIAELVGSVDGLPADLSATQAALWQIRRT
jgi:hypothetical protein